MALMPKRVKHRKSQRGRIRGNATRGNRVVFGDYGLQAEPGRLDQRADDRGRAHRRAAVSAGPEGRLYIRIFPHKPITSIPLETRMGKGKGEPEYWAAVVSRGRSSSRSAGSRKRRPDVFRAAGPQDAGESPFRPPPGDMSKR